MRIVTTNMLILALTLCVITHHTNYVCAHMLILALTLRVLNS